MLALPFQNKVTLCVYSAHTPSLWDSVGQEPTIPALNQIMHQPGVLVFSPLMILYVQRIASRISSSRDNGSRISYWFIHTVFSKRGQIIWVSRLNRRVSTGLRNNFFESSGAGGRRLLVHAHSLHLDRIAPKRWVFNWDCTEALAVGYVWRCVLSGLLSRPWHESVHNEYKWNLFYSVHDTVIHKTDRKHFRIIFHKSTRALTHPILSGDRVCPTSTA